MRAERELWQKEKKNERGTGRRKMKRASHGASGGALWNAASEGRMKALVTSHCTNVHTHTQARTYACTQPDCGAAETHSPAELSFEKKKVQKE